MYFVKIYYINVKKTRTDEDILAAKDKK